MIVDVSIVSTVRAILGAQVAHMSDEQIIAPAFAMGVERRLRTCWSDRELDELTGDELDAIKTGAAYLVAAMIVDSAPRVASTRLGDQQVAFESGAAAHQTATLEDRGWSLMVAYLGACVVTAPVERGSSIFRRAPGRRGA